MRSLGGAVRHMSHEANRLATVWLRGHSSPGSSDLLGFSSVCRVLLQSSVQNKIATPILCKILKRVFDVYLYVSLDSVESDPQCQEALTFADSSFGHQPPFYRYGNSPLSSPCDPYGSASISRPPGALHTHTQVPLTSPPPESSPHRAPRLRVHVCGV